SRSFRTSTKARSAFGSFMPIVRLVLSQWHPISMVCLFVAERGVIVWVHVSESFQQDTSASTFWEAPVNVTGAARNSAAGRMREERPGALLAHRTRTMKRDGMTRVPVPCSRSAHDQNVLTRRPQWDQHGCHSMGGE